MTVFTPIPAFTLSVEDLRQLLREEIRVELAAQAPAPSPATLSATTVYSVPEFAALLNVGEAGIYRDVKEGRISHVRIGTTIRIPETALAAYQQGCQS